MKRNTAIILLSSVWLFPLLGMMSGAFFQPLEAPLSAPGVGLLDSNRTLLLLLALGGALLGGLPWKRFRFAVPWAVFCGWAVLSSLLGLSPVNSLFFTCGFIAAGLVLVSGHTLIPKEIDFQSRVALLHLPILIFSAGALIPLMTEGGTNQVTGQFLLSNVYSNWTLFLLPFLVQDLLTEEGRKCWLPLLSTSVCLASLVLTYSRTCWFLTPLELLYTVLIVSQVGAKRIGAWTAYVGSVLMLLFVFRESLGGDLALLLFVCSLLIPLAGEHLHGVLKGTQLVRVLLLLFITGLLVFGVTSAQPGSQLIDQGGQKLERLVSGDNSASARVEFWKSALRVSNAHPLLGTGPDTFPLVYPQFQSHFYYYSDSPHSTTLELTSNLGWVGGLLFLLALVTPIVHTVRRWDGDPYRKMAAVGLVFGLAHAQGDVSYQYATLWTTLALVLAIFSRASVKAPDSNSRVQVVIFLVCLPGLLWLSDVQRQFERSKLLNEEGAYVNSRRASDRLPIWSEPALEALDLGLYLAFAESGSEGRPEALAELRVLARRALKAAPAHPVTQRLAADLARREGRLEEAQDHAEKALALDPFNYPSTYDGLYRIARRKGDAAEAGRVAERALQAFPLEQLQYAHESHRKNLKAQLIPLFYLLADDFSPYDQPKRTEPLYTFLAEETKSARAFHGLGVSLFTQGRYQEAYPLLQRAHRMNPIYPIPGR